jgi:hypothetical protein
VGFVTPFHWPLPLVSRMIYDPYDVAFAADRDLAHTGGDALMGWRNGCPDQAESQPIGLLVACAAGRRHLYHRAAAPVHA